MHAHLQGTTVNNDETFIRTAVKKEVRKWLNEIMVDNDNSWEKSKLNQC